MQIDYWDTSSLGAVTSRVNSVVFDAPLPPVSRKRLWVWPALHAYDRTLESDAWFFSGEVRFFNRSKPVFRLPLIHGNKSNGTGLSDHLPTLPTGGALPALTFGDVRLTGAVKTVEIAGYDLELQTDRVQLFLGTLESSATIQWVKGLRILLFPL